MRNWYFIDIDLYNFNKKTLDPNHFKNLIWNRIASSTYPQWISHAEDGCSSPKCFKGYYADVFHALQNELNFTYTITFDKVFGAKQKDGSWSGKIGDFIHHLQSFESFFLVHETSYLQ